MRPPPDDNWNPGGIGGGGGSSSGGSSGGSVPANLSELASSGGLFGSDYGIAIPVFCSMLGIQFLGTFDFNDFNTEEDCYYKYRVEELKPGRYVTIKMVQIIYRNLGPCIINVKIEGLNENNEYASINKDYHIGSSNPDNKLYELDAALEITLKRPQIILFRGANNGPLSIIRTTIVGILGEGNIL